MWLILKPAIFNSLRKKLKTFRENCNEVLKYPARIADIRNTQGKTYFTIQLVGKSTCSRWMTAIKLIENKQLFSAINIKDRELIKCIYQVEYNSISNESSAIFFISSIDLESQCIMSVTSINGKFQMKLTPHEVILNKKIYNNLNSDNQGYVQFYAGLQFEDIKSPKLNHNNIVSLPNKKK